MRKDTRSYTQTGSRITHSLQTCYCSSDQIESDQIQCQCHHYTKLHIKPPHAELAQADRA